MEVKSGLLEVKEKFGSCREPGNGVGFVWGFEVVGEEVRGGSRELLWCSLRVSTGCFAGRQEHTSAHGWCFLAPLFSFSFSGSNGESEPRGANSARIQ